MRVVTAVINLQFSVAKQCVQWTTVVKTRSQSYHCSSTVIPLQIFPVYPSNWKISKIIPLHRKVNKKLIRNYRPESLLSVLVWGFSTRISWLSWPEFFKAPQGLDPNKPKLSISVWTQPDPKMVRLSRLWPKKTRKNPKSQLLLTQQFKLNFWFLGAQVMRAPLLIYNIK